MKSLEKYGVLLTNYLQFKMHHLTHISLVVILWDIGKQHSPRCDAVERGVPSGAILFTQRNFIENQIKIIKITPNTPKNESGLIRLIMIGESIRQIWVKKNAFIG